MKDPPIPPGVEVYCHCGVPLSGPNSRLYNDGENYFCNFCGCSVKFIPDYYAFEKEKMR